MKNIERQIQFLAVSADMFKGSKEASKEMLFAFDECFRNKVKRKPTLPNRK